MYSFFCANCGQKEILHNHSLIALKKMWGKGTWPVEKYQEDGLTCLCLDEVVELFEQRKPGYQNALEDCTLFKYHMREREDIIEIFCSNPLHINRLPETLQKATIKRLERLEI